MGSWWQLAPRILLRGRNVSVFLCQEALTCSRASYCSSLLTNQQDLYATGGLSGTPWFYDKLSVLGSPSQAPCLFTANGEYKSEGNINDPRMSSLSWCLWRCVLWQQNLTTTIFFLSFSNIERKRALKISSVFLGLSPIQGCLQILPAATCLTCSLSLLCFYGHTFILGVFLLHS